MTYEQFKEDKKQKIEAISEKLEAYKATNPDTFLLWMAVKMALMEIEIILATPYPKYPKGARA